MSNGESSPVFEETGGDYDGRETLVFDSATPIRAVSAAEDNDGGAIWRITFVDTADNVIKVYNPKNSSTRPRIIRLGTK